MGETDAELVQRVRRGDRDAAGRLLERYMRGCRAVALAVAGTEADADDVCQDAFVIAMERIDDCRQPERFGGWLLQIVRNRARNLREARQVRSRPVADAPGPAAVPTDVLLQERILRAMETLSEVQREVVLLHDLEGWTHAEIAVALGISEGMSRQHLFKARGQLRECVDPARGSATASHERTS
jgi:RNA polymerase sigma-70 factor (ECF subfamily)